MHKLEYRGRGNLAKSFLTSEIVHAALSGNIECIRAFLDNGGDVNARSVFQSNLLHVAARTGNMGIMRLLVERGADVNALDYGGMRRTALHWACQEGHLRTVELLVAAGADTQVWCSLEHLLQLLKAKGKSWSQLVQGQRCGRMIDTAIPTDMPPTALCRSLAVRLALEQPRWSPQLHSDFPQRFKDVVRVLLLATATARRASPHPPAARSRGGSAVNTEAGPSDMDAQPSTAASKPSAESSSAGLPPESTFRPLDSEACEAGGGAPTYSVEGSSAGHTGDLDASGAAGVAATGVTPADEGPLVVTEGGSGSGPAAWGVAGAPDAPAISLGQKLLNTGGLVEGPRNGSDWPLGWDCTLEVIAQMVYPISSWVDSDEEGSSQRVLQVFSSGS